MPGCLRGHWSILQGDQLLLPDPKAQRAPNTPLLIRQGAASERGSEDKLLSVIIGYVVAVLVGLVFPGLAVAFYFGIAVYLVVPFREVGRLLFSRD